MSFIESGRASGGTPQSPTPDADESRVAGARECGPATEPDAAGESVPAAAEALSFSSPVGATLLVLYAWFAMAALFGPFSPAADDAGKLLLSAILVLALSVVHEIGHVLAGRLVGVGFRSLTIGPLAVVRRERGYTVQPNTLWTRFSGCVERDFSGGRPEAHRLIASALGGPAANLLLAAALFATGRHGGLTDDLALWSLLFGLFNLVPIRHGGQTSDGGLALALWNSTRSPRP